MMKADGFVELHSNSGAVLATESDHTFDDRIGEVGERDPLAFKRSVAKFMRCSS
jgi:hypothetical protein